MCGIVGYIAKNEDLYPEARQHFLKYALTMDTIRGPDSTGLVSVYDKFDIFAYRSVSSGIDFVRSKFYKECKRDGWLTVGHNRAATKGSVKIDNAHPFRFGEITLVHNGTLAHHGSNFTTFDSKLEVDSMQIALALSKVGAEEAGTVLDNIDGGFCIVWTDARDKSLNIARNYERPMHVTLNSDRNFMMFMSDGHMLTSINKSMSRSAAAGKTIYEIDSYKHLKWHKGDLNPEVKEFSYYIQPRLPHGGRWNGPPTRGHDVGKQRHSPAINSTRTLGSTNTPHLEQLKKLFKLDGTELMKFDVGTHWQLMGMKKLLVEGTLTLPLAASRCNWPASIMNVPEAAFNAYKNYTWSVRAIGIGKPLSKDGSPSIICEVDCFNWVTKPTQEEDEEEYIAPLIRGPNGMFVDSADMHLLLDKGCIACGGNLALEDATTVEFTNEGRDLICFDCSWEYDKR